MGKRSNFKRVEKDFYATPKEAIPALYANMPKDTIQYAEPCCGNFDLIKHLADIGYICSYASDITRGDDALELEENHVKNTKYIITNPPWTRSILHPMITRFRMLRPTWLLFDADWMHTKQAAPYLPFCQKIISIGRLKWIPDSKHTGKDNCCWYLFDKNETVTEFIGR